MSICHAIHNEPPYHRCELHAAHDDRPHEWSQTWDDDECFDPARLVIPETTTVRRGAITFGEARPAFPQPGDDDVDDDPFRALDTGTCFSCGCSEAGHAATEDGCAPHSCKTYVA